MLSYENRSLAGVAIVAVALCAGLLTWLCVGWFGNQSLLTAMVAVVLVEVFLASFGVIAMLLTERVTVTMLQSERRPAPLPKVRPRREPVWVRLPDPVAGSASSAGNSAVPQPVTDESEPHVIAFPTPGDDRPADRRRAA